MFMFFCVCSPLATTEYPPIFIFIFAQMPGQPQPRRGAGPRQQRGQPQPQGGRGGPQGRGMPQQPQVSHVFGQSAKYS